MKFLELNPKTYAIFVFYRERRKEYGKKEQDMMYVDLPKSHKKIARMLIDKALRRECDSFLEKVRSFMQSVNSNFISKRDAMF